LLLYLMNLTRKQNSFSDYNHAGPCLAGTQ
jgi:hypothetical protein